MDFLEKLHRDYPAYDEPDITKKFALFSKQGEAIYDAIAQLTGKEPDRNGSVEARLLDEILSAEVVNSVRPSHSTAILGRIADNLFNGNIKPQVVRKKGEEVKEQRIWLKKSKKTQKVLVRALVQLRYDILLENAEIISVPHLSAQDRQVYDAVSTLYLAGNTVMTYAMIYRVRTGGRDSGHKLPKAAEGQIEHALNACNGRFMLRAVAADESKEAEKAALTYADLKANEPLLAYKTRTVYLNGQFVRGVVCLLDTPVLLRLALCTHQLDTKPLGMKAIGTYRTQSLKELIVQRVSKMMTQGKNGKLADNQNVIRFDWLLKHLGEEKASDKRKRNLRDYTRQLLDELSGSSQKRPQEAFIAGYSLVKEGRTITGFRIDLLKK